MPGAVIAMVELVASHSDFRLMKVCRTLFDSHGHGVAPAASRGRTVRVAEVGDVVDDGAVSESARILIREIFDLVCDRGAGGKPMGMAVSATVPAAMVTSTAVSLRSCRVPIVRVVSSGESGRRGMRITATVHRGWWTALGLV